MRNLKQKKIWKDVVQSKPVLFFLVILILAFSWSILGLWNKMLETNRNKKIAEGKVLLLNEQKEKLSKDIDSLNTEEGKEKFFRENFGLAKEGENLIIVVEDKNLPTTTENTDSSGFFSFLMDLFK